MVELDFTVEGARFEPEAATPLMMFAVRATNLTPELRVQNLALTCQIRIEPTRRSYAGAEQARLADLFGRPSAGARRCTDSSGPSARSRRRPSTPIAGSSFPRPAAATSP